MSVCNSKTRERVDGSTSNFEDTKNVSPEGSKLFPLGI